MIGVFIVDRFGRVPLVHRPTDEGGDDIRLRTTRMAVDQHPAVLAVRHGDAFCTHGGAASRFVLPFRAEVGAAAQVVPVVFSGTEAAMPGSNKPGALRGRRGNR